MLDSKGECESGMMSICAGNVRAGYVEAVLRGPLAVVRYVSFAIEVIR